LAVKRAATLWHLVGQLRTCTTAVENVAERIRRVCRGLSYTPDQTPSTLRLHDTQQNCSARTTRDTRASHFTTFSTLQVTAYATSL